MVVMGGGGPKGGMLPTVLGGGAGVPVPLALTEGVALILETLSKLQNYPTSSSKPPNLIAVKLSLLTSGHQVHFDCVQLGGGGALHSRWGEWKDFFLLQISGLL